MSAAAAEAEVVLLSNGPGELYTWAAPVLRAVRRAAPDARVVLGLLPCPFASGHEARIAASLGFDAVASVAESLAFAAGGPRPRAFRGSSGGPGLVVGLGGDVAFPGRIASRLGYAAWRYSFEPYWKAGLERLLVPDARTLERARRRGAPDGRVEAVGNLVADAIQDERVPAKRPGVDVLVMAGSRRFEAEHMLGVFAAAAERIAASVPGARFHWPRSRLLTDEAVSAAMSARKVLDVGGVPTREDDGFLVTPGGTRIRVAAEDERYGLMRVADVALTIPGTNTLELGIAGVPSVVTLPLQKMELIPIENPLRYVAVVPVLGPALKRALVRAALSRFKFVALPNIVADESIVPELRGNVTPDDVARAAVALLSDRAALERVRARLAATMPAPGAADRLAAMIAARAGAAAPLEPIRG